VDPVQVLVFRSQRVLTMVAAAGRDSRLQLRCISGRGLGPEVLASRRLGWRQGKKSQVLGGSQRWSGCLERRAKVASIAGVEYTALTAWEHAREHMLGTEGQ